MFRQHDIHARLVLYFRLKYFLHFSTRIFILCGRYDVIRTSFVVYLYLENSHDAFTSLPPLSVSPFQGTNQGSQMTPAFNQQLFQMPSQQLLQSAQLMQMQQPHMMILPQMTNAILQMQLQASQNAAQRNQTNDDRAGKTSNTKDK